METDSSTPRPYRRILGILLFLIALPVFACASTTQQADRLIALVDEEVKERLALLDTNLVEWRLDDAVRRLIEYHLRYPGQLQRNLGRAIAYFPIFEEELAAAGVPVSLKYLPVIESALLPRAMSRVGAEGLWQFMPETAPEYGLRIDNYLDERLDAQLATRAAARYLQSAYDYLGDWSLAIAAYNAGKGGVRRAQRRTGGKHFWSLRRRLPSETRKYVPAFIAAVYLTEFYALHEIIPEYPHLDQQLMERIVVEQPLSFYRIAQVTGLSVDFIEQLNPAYVKGYLPGYEGGHNLLLPKRVVPALREYLTQYGHLDEEPFLPWAPILNVQGKDLPPEHQHYTSYLTMVAEGDSLSGIAERLPYTYSQLALWNNLTPLDTLRAGQAIRYFECTTFRYLPQRDPRPQAWRAPLSKPATLEPLAGTLRSLPKYAQVEYWVALTHRCKPSDLLSRYPEVNPAAFYNQNGITSDKALPAGSRVHLPMK